MRKSRGVRAFALAGLTVACLAGGTAPALAEDITPENTGEGQSLAAATGLPIPAAAVPKAPGSGSWSFVVSPSTSGLSFKATAGYARLSGVIRWNRSYSFTAGLENLPFNGGRIGAGGTITGSDIFKPIPVSGITGELTGPIEIIPGVSILGGAVSWTAKGIGFSGGLKLDCTTGSLTATASALILNERNFELSAEGLATPCTLGRAGVFDGRPFHADISVDDGQVSLDAGIEISKLTLFTTKVGSSTVTTALSNVAGSITSPDGKSLALAFKGTGGVDVRTSPLPTVRLKATVSGAFAFRGASIESISVKLSGVSINGSTLLPTLGLTTRLINDTNTAFTTP
ncbi:MAG: hypothetical protein JHC95_13030 [Solirubrobacteraceae bacterium]|nr:hypothetical protein [Solirubrobacteraceae bacterium]